MSQENSEQFACNSVPDWLDSRRYKSLLNLDRAGWAWKWLRRNPGYIAQMMNGASQQSRTVSPEAGNQLLTLSAADYALAWGLLFPGEPKSCGDGCQTVLARRLGRIGHRH